MPEVTRAQPIVIDGATGYVGSNLVWKLTQLGHQIRCIVRPGADEADLKFLQKCGAQIIVTTLKDRDGAGKALEGAASAVHLIGSIAPKRGENLEDLHGGQTFNLIQACQDTRVPRIIMVTAVGTDPNAASMYHRTKAQSEQLVKDSGLQYAIVRPSLIIGRLAGRRDSKLVSRYLGFIKGKKKSVPLIDNGTNRVQPLFIGDLVTAMSKIVEGSSWKNSVVELGGPETITMREFVERLMAVLDERKPITNLSPGVANLIAMVCERFQDVPTISKDQVILAGIDNVCRENSVFALTDGKPTGLDDALKTYLGTPTQPSSVRV
jgi:uncharacterized protein YbjT (DUF2867 family)